ncbi:MAG: dienelactone hydrolase family protein, partial [Calditrichota bacterium]
MDLDGVVSFHGSLGTNMPAEKGAVKASVLVCHGADDPFVSQESIDAFKQEMEAAEVNYTFNAYEGAVHSFTNPGADENGKKFDLPLAYNKEADETSWQQMQDFFEGIFN